MKAIKRLIKSFIHKFITPDTPPTAYNRKGRRTELKRWQQRQRRKE